MNGKAPNHQKAIIGSINHDFWLYDSLTGFDLTRPTLPASETVSDAFTLQTTTSPVKCTAAKSALVIIDMQNFFLSPAIGRPADSKGLIAEAQLLKYAIPAARKAGMQIIWLNWGLTEQDLETVPPAEFRAFGFSTMPADEFNGLYSFSGADPLESSPAKILFQNDLGKDIRIYKGLGQQLGFISLPDGSTIPAGRMLMRDQWNTDLSPALKTSYLSSLKSSKSDVVVDKTRISGLHLSDTPLGRYLQSNGIRTLFFAGVNTDQCVNATLTDAFCHGYDCILLRDGCATTSPAGSQECVESNVGRTMGFVVTCESFAKNITDSLLRTS